MFPILCAFFIAKLYCNVVKLVSISPGSRHLVGKAASSLLLDCEQSNFNLIFLGQEKANYIACGGGGGTPLKSNRGDRRTFRGENMWFGGDCSKFPTITPATSI